jgi:histidinol-phosphate aminotransferase
MVNLEKLVRENVLKLIPYSSARDDYKGKTGIFMDANENPYGRLNRYPDPYQKALKSAVARFKVITEEKIFLGNGSDEIIDLCIRIFCNPGIDKILTFTPTYGMYEVSASINDVEVIKVPLNSNFQIDLAEAEKHFIDEKLKLVFICSPNNPTSNSMIYEDVENILKKFKGIVVIDEAYIDFTEKPSFIKLVGKYSNLIVMQTFSKAFGLAAIRVGMAFSDPAILQFFNKMKPPYNISYINQQAALKKLERTDEYKKQVLRIKSERARLASLLTEINFVEKVFPSDANFLLVKVKDANNIYNTLVNKNIIVRNRTSVIENCLRITVGKKSENDLLINALKDISK